MRNLQSGKGGPAGHQSPKSSSYHLRSCKKLHEQICLARKECVANKWPQAKHNKQFSNFLRLHYLPSLLLLLLLLLLLMVIVKITAMND